MDVPAAITHKVNSGLRGNILELLNGDYQFIVGEKVQQMFADDIVGLVERCYKEDWQLDVGQILWYGVHKDEKPGRQRRIENMRMVPLLLTLISEEDLNLKRNGFSDREILKQKVVRLFFEAYEQAALLTHADVAFLLHISTGTVGKIVRAYMEDTKKIVPTRGIMHDIGPSVTHKRIIILMYLEGYQTPEIARNTGHSEDACDRYIKAFKKVRELYKNIKDEKRISQIIGMGPYLVRKYIEILKEWEANQE